MAYVEPIRQKSDIEKIKNVLKKQSNRNYLLFILGINTGLRISDLLKLKVADVKDKEYVELREQKTNKYKKFPITKYLKEYIKNYLSKNNNDEWLFQNSHDNRPISRIQAYRIICNACNEAGIKFNIGTHTMRKTFGYHFYNKTKDIALLQHIYNHSNPSVTLGYIGINQDIINSNLSAFCL